MESSPSDIISFIGKQLRYQVLPVHLLLEVCLTAYSTEEIIDARNTVLEAFCETTDYAHPRDLQTQSSRKDLISIICCLKDFPCAVGEERQYTNIIKLRSAYARLQGLSQIVDNWNFSFSNPDAMMSAQSTSLPDSDNVHHNAPNNIVEQAPTRTNQEIESPPVQVVKPEVISVNPEIQSDIPMQDDGPEAGPLSDLGLQALSFNPLPKEQEGISALLEPIVNMAVVKGIFERPRVAAVDEQAPKEDNPEENVEDEIASLSNDTTSSSSTSTTTTTSSDTSDEDNLPLMPFYQPGPRNRPMVPMVPEQSLPRREGLPLPSRPISIPPPTRPLPVEEWLSDDESSPSDMAPSRSKRRRSDRPH